MADMLCWRWSHLLLSPWVIRPFFMSVSGWKRPAVLSIKPPNDVAGGAYTTDYRFICRLNFSFARCSFDVNTSGSSFSES